jgi:uracil-DNA glycosylase
MPCSGIGSMLHAQAAAMAAALETGRVFVESPGHFLTASAYCGSNTTLDTCYFLPLSNCTLGAAGVSEQDLAAAAAFSAADLAAYAAARPDSPRVIVMTGAAAVRSLTPSLFTQPLVEAGVPTGRRYWWWRAQAIAYMLRPNARTRAEVLKRRAAKLRGKDLAAGCISLYVRHGDKQSESRVWDDAAYDAAVAQLRGIDSSLTRQVFLSTEDPQTVVYFTDQAHNWSTTYVKMKRK